MRYTESEIVLIIFYYTRMTCNVGGVDRTLRFVAGGVIMALGVYYGSWWGLLGLVLFLTAVFSRCPVYIPFGISTCPMPAAPSSNEAPTQSAPPEAKM